MREPCASEADHAACAAAIRTGSHSFHAASRLMPARMRQPAYALYAFCRLADDAVDLSAGKAAAVARLRRRLDAACAGRPQDAAADRCFADMMREHAMPRALPEALIDGLAWDAEGRRCADLSALRAYAARVAGAVGAMMTVLMGVREPQIIARACDLGVAMQLTNVARDVGEDAREGRLYLPLDWMRATGVDPEAFLAAPRFTPEIAQMVAALLAEAERLYDRAAWGVRGLPRAARPGIRAARLIYREIGRDLARSGFDSVNRRAVVSAATKRRLMALAVGGVGLPRIGRGAEPLAETRYLVEAVAACPPPENLVRPTVGDHIGRMAEIMMAAHQRETTRRLEAAEMARAVAGGLATAGE
ncbi:phytoene/squalene synthase family protein [Rubrimonas cliftonensis]|uniref:Phytoene synthase n=1 Tax=Rubrimonas cliftonensis TaxID=89524 RepID=A0A1H3VHH3_9RHOB|nr:phytoene/squalene synthase family protein [Rubrimonas cliftonensis]SDZ74243.1 phytoene synthase [Rubrimonas cliftonensis]